MSSQDSDVGTDAAIDASVDVELGVGLDWAAHSTVSAVSWGCSDTVVEALPPPTDDCRAAGRGRGTIAAEPSFLGVPSARRSLTPSASDRIQWCGVGNDPIDRLTADDRNSCAGHCRGPRSGGAGPLFFQHSLGCPGVEFQNCPGSAYLAQQPTNVTVDMHRDVAI